MQTVWRESGRAVVFRAKSRTSRKLRAHSRMRLCVGDWDDSRFGVELSAQLSRQGGLPPAGPSVRLSHLSCRLTFSLCLYASRLPSLECRLLPGSFRASEASQVSFNDASRCSGRPSLRLLCPGCFRLEPPVYFRGVGALSWLHMTVGRSRAGPMYHASTIAYQHTSF